MATRAATSCADRGSSSTDLSAVKELGFGNSRLQLRAEVYNVFNNVNLGQPNGVFGSQNFGRISTVATGSNMRQLQLGARFLF